MNENPKHKTTFLVTGASGFIGSRFCEVANSQGYGVNALLQRRVGRNQYPFGTIYYGSLPYEIPTQAIQNADILIHCAAAVTATEASEFNAVNVEGLKYLLELSKKHHLKRVVFLSSQSVVSPNNSDYAQSKRTSEDLIRQSGIPFVILRPGLVYGPTTDSLFGRMCKMVMKFPFLPLLGGGKSIVQPLHVDDLVKIMLASALDPKNISEEHNIGDPTGLSLRKFLELISLAEKGKKPLAISIPLFPIQIMVKVSESLNIKLPIHSSNLNGLKHVSRMETEKSMQQFGIEARNLKSEIALAIQNKNLVKKKSPLSILLVGAGKIGLLHALTLTHQEGVSLAGIVDSSQKALNFYRGLGFKAPLFSELEKAINAVKPEGVVIATPSHTHLPLTRFCFERGIAVLVEKPMAPMLPEMDAFLDLANQYPNIPCQVGYVVAQSPHLQEVKTLLQRGDFGKVIQAKAYSFQSHVMNAKSKGWEFDKKKSGGGVLINFSCHLLSMLIELFGSPVEVKGSLTSFFNPEIEDLAELKLFYKNGLEVPFFSSWSMQGLDSSLTLVKIKTEKGLVTVTLNGFDVNINGQVALSAEAGDFYQGYDPAPSIAGIGFAVEHQNFQDAIKNGASLNMKPQKAAEIERLIHSIYKSHPVIHKPHERQEKLNQMKGLLDE